MPVRGLQRGGQAVEHLRRLRSGNPGALECLQRLLQLPQPLLCDPAVVVQDDALGAVALGLSQPVQRRVVAALAQQRGHLRRQLFGREFIRRRGAVDLNCERCRQQDPQPEPLWLIIDGFTGL